MLSKHKCFNLVRSNWQAFIKKKERKKEQPRNIYLDYRLEEK